jgi:hypothetical protein
MVMWHLWLLCVVLAQVEGWRGMWGIGTCYLDAEGLQDSLQESLGGSCSSYRPLFGCVEQLQLCVLHLACAFCRLLSGFLVASAGVLWTCCSCDCM